MKKLLAIVLTLITLVSCEKVDLLNKHKKDKPCAVVSAETMPSEVTASFRTKYSGVTAEKWFNKDNNGYCALFTINGKKTLSQFNNDGVFLNEETDAEQEGNHQDDNDNDSECECETE